MQINDANTTNESLCLRLKILAITRQEQNEIRLLSRILHGCGALNGGLFVSNDSGISSSNNDAKQVHLILAGVWTQLELRVDLIILVKDPLYNPMLRNFTIDNTNGLLIIEPDNLISCTSITTALFCERKSWLNHIFSRRNVTHRVLLVGKLVHEIFLSAIKHRINDQVILSRQLDNLICNEKIMLEIYSTVWDINLIRNECLAYTNCVASWVNQFMIASTGTRSALANDPSTSWRLRGTCDIEDLMRSHEYGLKGKADVIGSVRVYNQTTRRFVDRDVAVLELKTGCNRLCSSHIAQVGLYNMMLESQLDVHGEPRASGSDGYLTYLANNSTLYSVQQPSHSIKRDLCLKRNTMNSHFKDHLVGPGMIRRPDSCRKCDRLTECILMGKSYDMDEDKFPFLSKLEKDAIGHLDANLMKFFETCHERITRLIYLGGKNSRISRTSRAEDEPFPLKLLQPVTPFDDQSTNLISFKRSSKYIENFQSTKNSNEISSQPDPKKIKLDVEGMRVKSFEYSGSLHLHCRVSIKLDRDGNNCAFNKDEDEQQVATGVLSGLEKNTLSIRLNGRRNQRSLIKPDSIYRIDRLTAFQQSHRSADLDLMRQVLVMLLNRGGRRDVRVRKLISDPDYLPQQNSELAVSLRLNEYLGLTELHPGCEPVVFDAVATNNYLVISEKQVSDRARLHSVVLAMVEVMISLDRRVLIVAQDTDKLIDLMNSFREICKFVLVNERSTRAQSLFPSNIVRIPHDNRLSVVEKYNTFIREYEQAPVLVTTFHTSRSNLLFTRQTFDYCIAYDCDRTELLISLAPMFCCERHIIIDIDDGQCESHNDDLVSTLGEHIRALRPDLYESKKT